MLMFTSFHLWSGMYRNPERTARMIYAMMGSRRNTDLETQMYFFYVYIRFLSLFVYPPYILHGARLL